jgi:hypothetical protein
MRSTADWVGTNLSGKAGRRMRCRPGGAAAGPVDRDGGSAYVAPERPLPLEPTEHGEIAMTLVERYRTYAEDFEKTFADDDWARLERHFTESVAYETTANGLRVEGRDNVLAVLRSSVSSFDRRCSTRALVTTGGPHEHGNEVRRAWAATYTLAGAPDIEIGGSERAVFQGNRIRLLEVEMTPETLSRLMTYAATHILPRTA